MRDIGEADVLADARGEQLASAGRATKSRQPGRGLTRWLLTIGSADLRLTGGSERWLLWQPAATSAVLSLA